ncbi:serine/threonine-protein kinase [Actinomadura nitritigenes]|uniref:serine/threonine-protein kinase n=1 Tax=Actinomadura nitritigenes TaxID=134602 RepID=UPI003D8B5063
MNESKLHAGLLLRDRYRLEQPVGQGGMGQVWRGTDLRLRRQVAIKVLLSDLASDQDSVARFRREAEAAAASQHPGVTVVFDIDEVRDDRIGARVFLVMELLEGRDLRAVISASPGGLPVARTVSFATQIADALAAAHARGVVHRDIKPQNLMVLPDDRIKICDFGISHLSDASTRLTVEGSSLGTPRYMAPEQFRGEHTDARTDLYALGCVIHEMLTGSAPFDPKGGPHALMYQHLNQRPPAPRSIRPEIPEHLDRLVQGMLAKNPSDRPVDAQAVAAYLRSSNGTPNPAAFSRTAVAPPHPAPGPPGPMLAGPHGLPTRKTATGGWRKGRTAVLASLAVLALIATGAFAILHYSGSSSPRTTKPSRSAAAAGTQQPAPTSGAAPTGGTAPTGGPIPSGLAEPGRAYKIGQTARVPFLNGGEGQLAITVTSIDRGTAADLTALKDAGAQTDGTMPFYARYTAKNLGGGVSDVSDTATNMEGVLQDGRTVLSTLSEFPKCIDRVPDNGELPAGSSYQACALFLASVGDAVTGTEWTQGQSEKYMDPHGIYWKP